MHMQSYEAESEYVSLVESNNTVTQIIRKTVNRDLYT